MDFPENEPKPVSQPAEGLAPSENPVEAPPVIQKRNMFNDDSRPLAFSWFAVFIVIAFLGTVAMVNYFKRPGESKESFTTSQNSLRYAIMMEKILALGPSGSEAKPPATILEDIQEKVDEKAKISDEAAMISLAVSEELKTTPNEAAFSRLERSKDQESRNIAEIYRSKTLTESGATQLSPAHPETFAEKLVAAHAQKKAGNDQPRKDLVPMSSALTTVGYAVMLVLLTGIGFIALLVGGYAHFSGTWKTNSENFFPKTARDSDRYAFRYLIYLALYLVLPILGFFLGFLKGVLPGEVVSLVLYLSWAGLLIVSLKIGVPEKDSLSKIIGNKENPLKLAGLGVAAALANFPVILLMTAVISLVSKFFPESSHPTSVALTSNPSLMVIVFSVFTAAIFAPFMEELTFRGLLFPGLAQLLKSPYWAMALQGFMFAIIHPQGLLIAPVLMLIGMMGSFVAYKTGSLIPGMVMHCVHNSLILGLALTMS